MRENAKTLRRAAIQDFKRQSILDAAERVFLERGLDGATVRSIAKAAGCATGTVYLYFDGKEAIYAALLGDSLDRLKAAVAKAVEEARKDPSQAERALRAFFDYYQSQPKELDLGLYLFQGVEPRGLSKALDKQLNDQLTDVVSLLAECLRQSKDIAQADAWNIVLSLVSHMVGCLILENTGRLAVMGGDARQIIDQRLEEILARSIDS